jgi:hypothetical protein
MAGVIRPVCMLARRRLAIIRFERARMTWARALSALCVHVAQQVCGLLARKPTDLLQ